MPTIAINAASFGACSDFVKGVVELPCMTEGQLQSMVAWLKARPESDPTNLADYLVKQGMLTRFQADTILLGRAKDLVLSNFTLVDVLGSGAMGTVYKASSTNDNNWYAIKIIPRRNVVSLTQMVEKVKLLKDIRHPRVSALVQLGAHGERVYLAWPFLEGGQKLDDFVRSQGRLTPQQAVQIGSQIASGLTAYHQQGLFHGLLKPTDILVGSDRRVRILDFGVGFLLACERGKSLLDTMTNTKALARGLDCAAPETHMNPLDRTPAGDRYSLGCILFFCLTGQYPFPIDNPLKKMLAHQFEEPPQIRDLNPDVPPRLASIIHRLLSKAPEDRFETTDEVVEAFRTLTTKNADLELPPSRSKSSMNTPPIAVAPVKEVALTPVKAPASAEAAPAMASGLGVKLLVAAGLLAGMCLGGLLALLLRG